MRGDRLVRDLYEHFQARDWDAAAALLHPDVRLRMPATDERFAGREQVMAFQRDYPEPWGELRVLRVLSDGAVTAAENEIVGPGEVFRCAAFWTVRDGLLHDGVEYWVTVGGDQPPPARAGGG
ncbi:ketosteroid isomerase-like protein [Geodermatophilus bullaregiensis]|uniref:nuclear transport factor 2 family protein n=1 Tax=Geodermatophilus bullaregiensis TaxID=1564160 RepID=UPI00195D67B0|nr:nuclear transport factor 2 family protein [Geodermatophilus bullaregiensis]MBM7808942.1 ketosteroid isomerase-like protein [Geodermatophilus bullaregiensis]